MKENALTARLFCYSKSMKRNTIQKPVGKAKGANLAIALSPEMTVALREVAEKTKLPVNALARMAVEATIEMVRRDGGLFLPLSFPATPKKE